MNTWRPTEIKTLDGQLYREGMTLYRVVKGTLISYENTRLLRKGNRWNDPCYACIQTTPNQQNMMWNLVFRLYANPASAMAEAIEEQQKRIAPDLRLIKKMKEEYDRLATLGEPQSSSSASSSDVSRGTPDS